MLNRKMYKALLGMALALGGLAATGAAQAQVAVSVNPWYNNITVGAPLTHGVYGQIVIGDGRVAPPVYYSSPRVITRTRYVNEPIYLYVPDVHRKDWKRYCKRYDSCNRPVYFVNANSPRAKAKSGNNGNAYGHYGKGKYYNGNANLHPKGQRDWDRDDDRRGKHWKRDDDRRGKHLAQKGNGTGGNGNGHNGRGRD